MKVIFLDIDGVLNNDRTCTHSPSGWVGISSGLLDKLRVLVNSTDAKIVLTSTWKLEIIHDITPDGLYLLKKFRQKNLLIMDYVRDIPHEEFHRGQSILNWLACHDTDSFVILDDIIFDYAEVSLMSHLVLTDSSIGITNDDVNKAIDILNAE